MNDQSYIFVVVVGTMFVLSLIGITAFLMVVNTNRRHRHRADLLEADLRREGEVMQAEREATEQTLSEVGRELHDNVGQLLTVAQVGFMDRLEGELDTNIRVSTAMDALVQSMDELRRLGRSLNSDHWQERTIAHALENEAARIERLGIAQVHFTLDGQPQDPPATVKTILFRTFQEVLNNALKHSRANTIAITLSGNERVALMIADNGCGFDEALVKRGSGLVNIRRRCALIGYTALLETAKDKGCRWSFTPTEQHGT